MSRYDDKVTAPRMPDLSKPSCEGLIYLLRHKELWPEGFAWYFRSCRTCAMGLAYEFWNIPLPEAYNCYRRADDLAHRLNFPEQTDAGEVFIYGYDVHSRWGATPEQVADRLERATR